MAIQFEYKLLEQEDEVRGDAFTLEGLAINRELAELRRDGWELASTVLSSRRLSSPFTPSYAIRLTYTLRRPVASTKSNTRERAIANPLRLRECFPK